MRKFLAVIATLVALQMACEPHKDSTKEEGAADSSVLADSADPLPIHDPLFEPPPQKNAFPSFADIVQEVRPAVVNIFTKSKVRARRVPGSPKALIPRERLAQSLGSGFILDSDGHVLTNFHVIKGATKIEVRLLDERKFEAEVVGEDPTTDIALLQIKGAADLPFVALADSEKLRVGDWVLAIGNPLGLTSTVTAGIASATGRRNIPMSGDLRFQDFIQTDASINPGSSGGPLIDAQGRVVGVNTVVNAGAHGIGFAIPINMVKELMPKLRKGGRVKRAWLGIYVDDVPEKLRAQIKLPPKQGALVTKLVRGGPGDRATIRPGDVILAMGDEPIEDSDELAWVAGNHDAGDVVFVSIQRGSEAIELSVTLGPVPQRAN